jgi:hypothetical protein
MLNIIGQAADMEQLIPRHRLENRVLRCARESSVTVLLGVRQTGKTTVSRLISGKHREVQLFDLERAAGREALSTPELTLGECRGLVVIDEVHSASPPFSRSCGPCATTLTIRPGSCCSAVRRLTLFGACQRPWRDERCLSAFQGSHWMRWVGSSRTASGCSASARARRQRQSIPRGHMRRHWENHE